MEWWWDSTFGLAVAGVAFLVWQAYRRHEWRQVIMVVVVLVAMGAATTWRLWR
jgi:hypothetical protein